MANGKSPKNSGVITGTPAVDSNLLLGVTVHSEKKGVGKKWGTAGLWNGQVFSGTQGPEAA